jgi:DNA-binding MarR family transcriptional regulator
VIRDRMQNHAWDTSLDREVVPLFLALQWVQARAVDGMRPLLDRQGLSMAEFDVLATLRNAPSPHEATPSQIQDRMVITSGGLTKVLHQLEQRELVTRSLREGDHRVKPVRLTARGRRTIEAAMAAMVGATGAWFRNALDASEIAQLTALLDRLLQPRQP